MICLLMYDDGSMSLELSLIISFLAPSGTQFLGSDLCQPNAMLAVRSFNPAALAYERQGQSPCEDVVSLQLTWFVLLRALLHQLRMRLPTQPCLGERKARVRQLCTTSEPPTCIYIYMCHGGGTHKVYKVIFIFTRLCQPYEFLYFPAIARAMPYKPHMGFM